ncbi:DUF2795 domain-containing protein [Streptomyces gobiensis]|uniref:DUF2795 domain-containing protein n=1 Tax=Streptomyces gobiensis TaxID=2875706 RepID=UPI001E4589C9|nr:DUF2795 domain-containing protein [Streptomyces gobiensis]UGY92885.1 DUF2795 domain-containing protein [Streptomyces gobiensis]
MSSSVKFGALAVEFIERFFRGLTWPATKEQVLDQARSNGMRDAQLKRLGGRLRDGKKYQDGHEVLSDISAPVARK